MQRTEVRRRNRAALLAAAITEMARRGYQAARLEDIAASAGLTTGAIYSIFGSKRKLMDAAVQLVSADLEADLAPMRAPELSLDDTLRGYARTVFTVVTRPQGRERYAVELEAVIIALRGDTEAGPVGDAIPAVIDRLTRILTDRTTPHLPSGRTTAADASRIATALAAVLRGLTQQAVLMPGSVDQDYAADAAAALAGLLVGSRADTKR
jgi:AcrR family transcriptional regulator